ncbi:MAG: cell division protein [Xanthomonadales bacterium]|nr:permease-like cell division protein FtsX [Gammaproteobacteria bacterium]MBT8054972.1 permease-like cell division protein FtsX [Gammaproteobacteria bacterium]NND56354.1 cell division protein [Xanthomonadales bacterium]NNK52894.1 cell division protein [Xanthomonadales bacterium]
MSAAGLRRKSRAWTRRQLYSFFSSLGTLLNHRVGTLMTVLVLGIAMALPLGLYVTVKNLRAIDLQQNDWGTITVFLRSGMQQQEAAALADLINRDLRATVVTVSPVEGMEQFRAASGFGRALEMFDENPLPWVLLVTPASTEGGDLGAAVTELDGWLQQRDEVELVQVDFKWLQRLAGLLELGQAFVLLLTVLFSLAVIVVVSNTIRLDVASRAEEIQVLSLVGAGNGFIRQPFLYSGFWYGLLGALLSLLLFNLCLYYLRQPLERLLDAYGNTFVVQNLGMEGVLAILAAGGLLGLLGAWAAVHRYLRQLREHGTLGKL